MSTQPQAPTDDELDASPVLPDEEEREPTVQELLAGVSMAATGQGMFSTHADGVEKLLRYLRDELGARDVAWERVGDQAVVIFNADATPWLASVMLSVMGAKPATEDPVRVARRLREVLAVLEADALEVVFRTSDERAMQKLVRNVRGAHR